MTVDTSERQFLVSSIADPAQTVEPHQMRLIIYTAARSGEVLLKVRCFGQTHLF